MVTSPLNATAWRAKQLTTAAYQRAVSTSRTAVVVGATSGIGRACANRLAQQGFLVVAVGRERPGRAEAVVEAPKEESKNVPSRSRTKVWPPVATIAPSSQDANDVS